MGADAGGGPTHHESMRRARAASPRGASPRAGVPRREALKITAVAGVSLVLGGGLLKALIQQGRLHLIRRTRTQLGTFVTITVIHPDREAARRLVDAGFTEMSRLEGLLSRHRSDTPLARLNRDGLLADAPPELIEVLGRALEYSELSDGAFDVTVAPVLELYSSRSSLGAAPPTDADVAAALPLVGYRGVHVDRTSVTFDRPGMSVTLDGIAKGYIVDRTVAAMVETGAEQVTVDAGGDVASGGKDVGAGLPVGIQDPRDPRAVLEVLELHGTAIATSGDYVQSFTEDRTLHHILDPRTGRSPKHTSAVTVVTPTAMDADALSTAVLVLGPRDGLGLLDRLDDVEGLIVTKSQDQIRSRGFGR